MLVLKILGVLALVLGIFFFLCWIASVYNEKFESNLFTGAKIFMLFISGIMLYAGYNWYEKALKAKGDKLNGLIIMALAILIVLGMIIEMYVKTNFIFGTLAMIIYLLILAFFTFAGVPIILLFLGGCFLAALGSSKEIYVKKY